METIELIPADQFCVVHNIELSFINQLQEFGLIEIVYQHEACMIPIQQLENLEKFMRFHYELDINLEGIQAIAHLLGQMKSMEEEILRLKRKLSIYE